jgi:polyphosphate glucokinase
MEILGVDVGGSGIKAAVVDTETGNLLSERKRLATPQPSKPEAVSVVIRDLANDFRWEGRLGCGFPSAVQNGVVRTAANIDQAWIDTDATELFNRSTGCQVTVINDADAAGLAEMRFGAGRDQAGVVMIITIGTGLGTALFTNRQLLPNCELGHLFLEGKEVEKYASDATRKERDLNWKKWGKRFNEVLQHYEALFWPDLFILGGGASKRFSKFSGYLKVRAEVVPAQFLNEAGIVGAAIAASLSEG